MKPMLSRRHFLQASAIAATLAPFTSGYLAAAQSGPIKKSIPASGEKLSVIGLGTSRTFDVNAADAAQSPLLEVMRSFFANGGQLIDSSPMYGSAEAVTGALLQALGDTSGLFTATKVWTYGKREGIEQMQRSMQRLGSERYQPLGLRRCIGHQPSGHCAGRSSSRYHHRPHQRLRDCSPEVRKVNPRAAQRRTGWRWTGPIRSG